MQITSTRNFSIPVLLEAVEIASAVETFLGFFCLVGRAIGMILIPYGLRLCGFPQQ
jgi:hypothetical protein